METSILSCRLIQSAMLCGEDMAVADYACQFEEFKALAHEVFNSEEGYFVISEILDEALGILTECHIPKKINHC